MALAKREGVRLTFDLGCRKQMLDLLLVDLLTIILEDKGSIRTSKFTGRHPYG